MKLPKLIAHRGASKYAPENTMAAFKKAFEMGATWVETDVMLTKDHIPILHHDDSLKRTTGVNVCVQDCTFAQIEQYDAGSYFSSQYKGEKIPRLEKLLMFLMKHDMGLNLELKPTLKMETETAWVAMQTVTDMGFPKEKILISSFSMLALEKAYAHSPEYHFGWLCDNKRSLDLGLSSDIPFASMHLSQSFITPQLIASLRERGYQNLVFTVNEPAQATRLFKMGVASIFSDEPQLLG
jgi:glycerophosphoryl diester phosphodiesterase